jgi:hypothetical protein
VPENHRSSISTSSSHFAKPKQVWSRIRIKDNSLENRLTNCSKLGALLIAHLVSTCCAQVVFPACAHGSTVCFDVSSSVSRLEYKVSLFIVTKSARRADVGARYEKNQQQIQSLRDEQRHVFENQFPSFDRINLLRDNMLGAAKCGDAAHMRLLVTAWDSVEIKV